ncbi:MAG: hypothetical protein AB1505_13110 [Candidatus Latescibacterota bacterium]
MKPQIEKLGTVDVDLVETNPVVFADRLYRFEYVRPNYPRNHTGDSYFRFVDRETGEPTPAFARGRHLGCAFVEGHAAYVTCVDIWDGEHLILYTSNDLRYWDERPILDLPGYGLFNTSLCRAHDRYVLMFEVGKPPRVAGVRFTGYFAFSTDLAHWELAPPECNYAKDRYTAPHCLRYLNGSYYDFYLEAHEGYEQRVVRSRDLVHWEASPHNPVLKASPEDRRVANPKLTPLERQRIATATNLNNSDIDFCEHRGRVLITYSWGNQQGVEHLAEAVFPGTEQEFLEGWFAR